MSFNRPQFLGPVIDSIKAQPADELLHREVHLFQDGAVNRYSRMRYANGDDIARSIALFRAAFPTGTLHVSDDNIGICENFRRAETYFFVERRFPCAWFFEDDLVLSPAYFKMLSRLEDYANTVGHIAYFSAYGDYYENAETVALRGRELTTLDHHWGFGLIARHWSAMQPELEAFYRIVVGNDYARRDHRAIFGLYEPLEIAPRASSQDAAKAIACSRLALWRCNSVQPFARYIGSTGLHMTPEAFNEIGFSKVSVASEPQAELNLPGPAEVRERVLQNRELFQLIRRTEFESLVAALPARELNPMRRCTREDVAAAYDLLLRRDVEDESVFTAHVDHRPVWLLVAGIRSSTEFMQLVDSTAPQFTFIDVGKRPPCTTAEISAAYRLLMHREPEPAVLKDHVAYTPKDALIEGLLQSSELMQMDERMVP